MVWLCWGALVRHCGLEPRRSLTASDQVRLCDVFLRSLDAESAAIVVHAFVTSRVDYCNAILAGASKSTTDKLQRVMNAAARRPHWKSRVIIKYLI